MSSNGPDDQRRDQPDGGWGAPPPPPGAPPPPPGGPSDTPPGPGQGGPEGGWGQPPGPGQGGPEGGWGQPPGRAQAGQWPGEPGAHGAPQDTGWGYGAPPGYGYPPGYGVAPPEGGVIENAVRVVTSPVDTLRRLTHHPRIGWAIGIVVVVSLLGALAGAATFDTTAMPGEPFGPGPDLQALRGVMLVAAAIFGPLFTLLFVLIWAALLHGMARLLKGTGAFAGTFTGVSFAYVVTVLAVPFQLLPLGLGGAGSVLAGIVGFALFIWSLVLDVIAVRECHHLTTGRAVAAVLVPIAALFALAMLFVILIVALVVGGLAGMTP